MDKKYFVGLDVGSDSVGWAATDLEYKLLRMKGKTAWGSRLFDEAHDAKARRVFRTSGRRAARRKYRIALLNSLFKEEIDKKDDTFFIRLSQSAYHLEDKEEEGRFLYPLFKDKEIEKAFYKEYPTIWHLRAALIKNDQKALGDIRNVYLAIHHIIKYRGNFLHDGAIDVTKFDFGCFDRLNDIFSGIQASLMENEDEEVTPVTIFQADAGSKILAILKDEKTNKVEKKKAINLLIHAAPELKNYVDLFVALVVGGSYDLTKIDPECDEKKITFASGFDDKEDKYRQILGESYSLVEEAKNIYDYVYLFNLLGDESYVSSAFAAIYETHKKDLKDLKHLLIASDKALNLSGHERNYWKVFSDPANDKNYAAFVHVGSEKKRPGVHDFNSYIGKILVDIVPLLSEADRKIAQTLQDKAIKDELLLAVSNVSNSTIPHQLHEVELKIILQNAGRIYPTVKANSDKIISLFRFRVPYYFGPLDTRSPFSHLVRKENVTITPWNQETAVDDEATRRRFMNSLTNNCSYLFGENVMPRDSIEYQDFINLNRLNGLRINGSRIEQSVKMDLFKNLISKKAKTSIKGIECYLTSHYEVYKKDGASVSGLNEDDDFVSSSRAALQGAFDLEKDREEVENIILIKAIYSDCFRDAMKSIQKQIKLTQLQEKAVSSLVCKGWGNLSRAFLDDLRSVDANGEFHHSIIELLRDRPLTMMEILHDDSFGFQNLINQYNDNYVKENNLTPKSLADRLIEEASPMDRRATIQAVRIVREIAKIAGSDPEAIAIEVTRTNKAAKDKTISRKVELLKFLSAAAKDAGEYKSKINASKDELLELDDIMKLKGKHVYLYFKQMGLDMYTGLPIHLSDVLNGNSYDIDHIVPQSKIKDDSLDNMVLVKREINQKVKRDQYPLPAEIRLKPEVVALWKFLLKKKGISASKYNALMRESPITDAELSDFVSRQINVVNQSNKLIRDVLKAYFPNTDLIFSKAYYPSYLRKTYGIPKVRDLNDCHHAVDAYLNIVCGTVLYDTYSRDMRAVKWRQSHPSTGNISYNMERTMDRKMAEPGFLKLVVSTSERHDFLLTYRVAYQDNAFYNQTINRIGFNNALIPVHSASENPLSDISKYGGFTGLIPEYFVPITYGKKNKRLLGRVPTLYSKLYHQREDLVQHLIPFLGLEKESDVKFDFSSCVLSGQKMLIKGREYLFQSMNANQLTLKPVTPVFLSSIDSDYLLMIGKKIDVIEHVDEDSFTFVTDKDGQNKYTISKERNEKVYQNILDIAKSPKYTYCPMISNLRDETLLPTFKGLSLHAQASLILQTIKLFGRNSATTSLKANYFSKGLSVILDDHPVLIFDSVTGLYSTRNAL